MKNQKKEFFKREDIKTMQKDISQLREQEAEKEREKIAALKTAEETRIEREKQEKIKRGVEEKERRPPVPIPPTTLPIPPSISVETKRLKPAPSEKILIRVGIMLIIVLIFVNIFLFWNWYLREEALPGQVPPEEVLPEEVLPEEVPPEEVPPEIIIPLSLIPIEASSTLEISAPEELSTLFSQVLKTELTEGYTRILIQDIEENKILGLKEFLEGFGVKVPEGFYEKVGQDFTLFLFKQKQGNRWGLVTKITEKENLAFLLKNWEETMEQDFGNLFTATGKEGPALTPYFRAASYKGASLRYQTFSRQDLGICYSLFNDYFVFTSSWESLLKTIDQLASPPHQSQ